MTGHGSVASPEGPPMTRVTRSLYPWSNSWLPTEEALRHISFITSIVGWSCWTAELNSDAPIKSPAPNSNSDGSVTLSCSIVVAHLVVRSPTGSIRPWKSLTLSNVNVTGAACTTAAGATPAAVPSAARAAIVMAVRRCNFDLIDVSSLMAAGPRNLVVSAAERLVATGRPFVRQTSGGAVRRSPRGAAVSSWDG